MLKHRIHKEIALRKHPMQEWNESVDGKSVAIFKEYLDTSKFKVVVGLCIYNEEQFIRDTLQDCLKIQDLDAIHILDGAWVDGGTSHLSTDKTHDIIVKWIIDNDVVVTVERKPDKTLWESESIKRNYQLDRIHQLHGPSYVLVHDGDELLKFNCGRENIFLKETLSPHYPKLITMKSYSYNGVNDQIGVRVIPTGFDIHYHTDKPMLLHNESCAILVDYNFHTEPYVDEDSCWPLDIMFYVNRWNSRDLERVKSKDSYCEKVWDDKRIVKNCEYKHL
jgi:hypothetical protein